MSRISVVIPIYNKWHLTAACLRSLAEHTAGADLQVVVADNASCDDSISELEPLGRELFGDNFVRLRFDKNINYGPACNAGAEQADGELLFLLNNDTILTPNWLPPLLEELQRPHTAGVGPVLTYADQTVQHLGICISALGNKVFHLYARLGADHPLAQKKRSFPAITAAALLLPRRKFLDAGGFFSEYINGFEDVDLCLKLTSRGDVMRVTPGSRFFHLEGQSENRHQGEARNSAILSGRWQMAEHENMTRIAAQDGYEVQVDPMLNAVFKVPEARKLELFRQARPARKLSLPLLEDLLALEPLWEDGYLILADALAAQGELEMALRAIIVGFDFVGSFNCLEKAFELAERLSDQDQLQNSLLEIRRRYQTEKMLILDSANFGARLRHFEQVMARAENQTMLDSLSRCALEAERLRAQWRKT